MMSRFGPAGAALALCLAGAAAAQTATAPAAPAAAGPPAPPPPACTTPEFRQFDFWVGRWDVYPTGTEQLIAHSLIENLYAGCAIRENWMPLRGGGGGSFSVYRPGEHRWRQTWTDATNSLIDFYGGPDGGKMVLTATRTGPNGAEFLVRMEYSRNPDGSVRQVGTRSTDHGGTWQPSYDFTYRPARAPTG